MTNRDQEASGSGSGSGSDSSSDDEPVESMLATRAKRSRAHQKFKASIAQYLDVEDVEESYQKMFGEKLAEGDESDEFEASESSSGTDSADSDFSDSEPEDDQAPETQEIAVVDEENAERKKKKQQIKNALTKKTTTRRARPPLASKASDNVASDQSHVDTDTSATAMLTAEAVAGPEPSRRMSSRTHSVRDRSEKHKASQERAKLAKTLAEKRKPAVKHVRLTQAQRLEAAKETERINLAALDYYTKLEVERKKKRAIKKRTIPNPVRFRSVVVDTVGDGTIKDSERESREFITFGDVTRFPAQYFDQSRPEPQRGVCAVTGAPANYFDPVTKKAYASMAEFKQLRASHTPSQK